MKTKSRNTRTAKTKVQVLKRLESVIDVAIQIETLAKKGDEMLSELIEDINWSTGDCVIGRNGEFDPPDYVYNVICNAWEGGLFKDKMNDPNASEPYFVWLNELIQELKPRRLAKDQRHDHD